MYPTAFEVWTGGCDGDCSGVGARINDPQVFDRPPDLTRPS
jgi:hypothetical protein